MSDNSSHPLEAVFHPTDFSPSSHVAFDHALRISLANRSFFDILHVGSDKVGRPIWSEFPQVRGRLADWGLLQKGSPKHAVAEALGIHVRKVELGSRNPLAAMTSFLEEEGSDLIVLATEGRDGLPGWLKPSISEGLARKSKIATLFVPSGARGFVSPVNGEVRLRRVLLPVDHKPHPQGAIDAAGWVIQSLSAEAPQVEAIYIGDASRMPSVVPPRTLACEFKQTIHAGKAAEEVIKTAQARETDLIVMATEGREGFLDALRGSTTEQVVRRAPCPVLAIPVN